VALGAAALPLGHAVLRARPEGRTAPAALGAAAALGGAWLVWWAFLASSEAPPPVPAAGLGFLAALVASLGLLGSCLTITRDPVAEAIDAARAHLDLAGLALCERAATAAAKIRTAATGASGGLEARRAAAEVDGVARRVVLEIVALSRRQRAMAREAETPGPLEIEARLADLDARLAGATDALARDEYGRAREAVEDQRRRLGTLRASADRVMARLHTDVAALEGAALAIAARGGAATAEDAAALAPLADRLRGASGDVDLETDALREAASV
jgi:hypothetical protein